METIAFRDLRQSILTACDHRCHYCGCTAHQIRETVDQEWIPICRTCNFKTRYLTFNSEPDKRAYLAKRSKTTIPDDDMTLLRRGIERDGLI